MSNDGAEHEFAHVLALVQEQMQDLTAMEQKRATLTAIGKAADGAVEVTVDAQRLVTSTVIDESYLDDFDFADLGEHVTAAAQAAGVEIEQKSAALLAPFTERREEISSASGSVVDMPDFGDLWAGLQASTTVNVPPRVGDGEDGSASEGSSFPVVRGER